MATIYYALSGEGRGHATRARAVIEALRAQHQVKVYTYGHARSFLAPVYRGTDVEVRAVAGMEFQYRRSGQLDYARTFFAAMPFLARLGPNVTRVCRDMEREAPALVVTDFEPIVPRAATRLGVPFISLDHQHFLLAYDLRCLPLRLRWYAKALAPFVRAYYRGQIRTIVSSFYFPPLNPTYPGATRIGVLLRPEILNAEPSVGNHLVAYVRRALPRRVVEALADCGLPVRVYGLGARPSVGSLSFKAVDPFRFAEDLASCRALVSTAGNQLVGEALYLRKPVLGLPEPGNREQEINGYFLTRSGWGQSACPKRLAGHQLRRFVDAAGAYREQIDPSTMCGNGAAFNILRHQLGLIEAPARPAWKATRVPWSALGGLRALNRNKLPSRGL